MRFKGKSSHEGHYASDYYGGAYAEPEMMPQMEAMRHFRLSKDELKPLRVKMKLNPVDPHFAPMKLYRIADLQVRFVGPNDARVQLRSGANCRARAAVSAQAAARGRSRRADVSRRASPRTLAPRLRPCFAVPPRSPDTLSYHACRLAARVQRQVREVRRPGRVPSAGG